MMINLREGVSIEGTDINYRAYNALKSMGFVKQGISVTGKKVINTELTDKGWRYVEINPQLKGSINWSVVLRITGIVVGVIMTVLGWVFFR